MLWQCAGLGWMDWTAKPRRSHYSLGRRGTHARKMARLACWVFAPFEMFREHLGWGTFPSTWQFDKAQGRMDWRKESKDMPITLIQVVVVRKTELDSSFGLIFLLQEMHSVLFACSSPS